jgi:cobalt/nickel transport system ATP-binding protein
MSEIPLIELTDIHYSPPGHKGLFAGLDFKLMEGENVGLIGANGTGKTTLLHLIMGLVKPRSGTIRVFGREVKKEKDFSEVRRQVGFLFQQADDQLFSPTVIEDVAFGPLNLGNSPEKALAIARQTLADLNLAGFEDRITYKLSGGEKKLVSLATVLAMQPRVLLLDEPTTGLDELTRERISEILINLHISYIIVSHEYDFLSRTTSEIYGLQNGRIVCNGESTILHQHFHQHTLGGLPHKHS